MKRKVLLSAISIILFLLIPTTGRSQEIFNTVLNNANRVINDPMSTYTNTQVAQFKANTLQYFKRKAVERGNVTFETLDYQAYYLSEFLNLFMKELVRMKKLPKEEQKRIISLFIDASGSNPFFNDTDKETVHVYVTEKSDITPFSLDTDWEKALAAVQSVLSK